MVSPQQPNTVGNASLIIGIASIALVFGIGLCALVGVQQGWINVAGTPLYVCGASSAFLGLLGVILGIAGLFGANRSKTAAIIGLLFGAGGICLFLVVVRAVTGG